MFSKFKATRSPIPKPSTEPSNPNQPDYGADYMAQPQYQQDYQVNQEYGVAQEYQQQQQQQQQQPQEYRPQDQYLGQQDWQKQQEYYSQQNFQSPPKEYQQPPQEYHNVQDYQPPTQEYKQPEYKQQEYNQQNYNPQEYKQPEYTQPEYKQQEYKQPEYKQSDYKQPEYAPQQEYKQNQDYLPQKESPKPNECSSKGDVPPSPIQPEKPPQEMPPKASRQPGNPLQIYPIDSKNVKVLFEGYSKFVNSEYFANCTSVLIKGGPNIMVDTMTVWDEEKMVQALRNEGLSCDDIDFLICTHGHSDHTGCNHLFKKAIHIVGYSISFKDQYYLHPDFRHGEEFNIDSNTNAIRVIPTPGHTLQDVSVLIYSDIGVIVITGDLFEKVEDLENEYEWLLAGSDNQKLQRKNRQKILEIADYIIPGHGAMFKVPARFKTKISKPRCD